MKRFIKKIVFFSIPFIIYSVFIYPPLMTWIYGPTTQKQIEDSFKGAIKSNYEIFIMGNSRIYRGINPDCLSWSAYNFSHDNDTYNQIYYKLKYLLENDKHFKYLILGTDYFQFSIKSNTRNYVYGTLFDEDYMKDYDSNIIGDKIRYYSSTLDLRKILHLLKREFNKKKPFVRENGQYIVYDQAHEDDSIAGEASNRLDFQVDYFKKIIDLCKSEKIKIFIVMPPVRTNVLRLHSKETIDEFNSFINSFTDKDVYFMDYSTNENFETKDYTDISHFNESGANKFSKILNKDLEIIIQNTEK